MLRSDDTIAAVVGNLTAGCGTELHTRALLTALSALIALYHWSERNLASEAYPVLANNEMESIQSQCGESFTDGTAPSGITETAQKGLASSTVMLA
ncbi:uncharacterized protein BT62DRAFT_103970 [Guyanagaster necrorhizus]|uniref:Uncharacterized protein n=1 Tax=Guyanagaster necrorhizus TaxID=856835 RepID=A0A9P8ASE6_9AGAR|nr:uncharacterized protein BT62DRAFT_103970 [Guyanagaster necrorhizus MCA 3950]KAG7446224.1 hypothetical protein BT62DRAFT_103970 [Guyanagaster necrorhizus MCA 3950]